MTRSRREALTQTPNQLLTLHRDRSLEDIPARPSRNQQGTKKRSLEICSMMLARHSDREHLRSHPCEVQADVIDRVGFPHSRTCVYERPRHQHAQAPLDQIDKGLDGG